MFFARLNHDPTVRAYFVKRAGSTPPESYRPTAHHDGIAQPRHDHSAGGQGHVLHVLPAGPTLRRVLRHALAIRLCYCSLNGSCWTLHSDTGSEKSEQSESRSRDCTDRGSDQCIGCYVPFVAPA